MSKAKITLIGLENYCNGADESLFSDLVLPSGINKDNVVNNILMRANEFELLYSDPIFLKSSIALWGRTWYKTFERWNQTLLEEYNPIHNYDRTEEISERIDEDTVNRNSSQSSGNTSGSSKATSKIETDNTTTDSTAAYNTSSFDNKDKSVLDGETKSNDSTSSSGTSSSSDSSNGSENKDIVRQHNARMFGNIGVTTSAAMVSEELLLREKYNLYKMIADVFVKEFCIMVY